MSDQTATNIPTSTDTGRAEPQLDVKLYKMLEALEMLQQQTESPLTECALVDVEIYKMLEALKVLEQQTDEFLLVLEQHLGLAGEDGDQRLPSDASNVSSKEVKKIRAKL